MCLNVANGMNRPAPHPGNLCPPSHKMNPQRVRRPTAWEVSFPDEMREGDDDDEKEGASEAAEREFQGMQDDMPVLTGKRKIYTNVDDRVRIVAFLFRLLIDSYVLSNVLAGEAP